MTLYISWRLVEHWFRQILELISIDRKISEWERNVVPDHASARAGQADGSDKDKYTTDRKR